MKRGLNGARFSLLPLARRCCGRWGEAALGHGLQRVLILLRGRRINDLLLQRRPLAAAQRRARAGKSGSSVRIKENYNIPYDGSSLKVCCLRS